jgi:DHHC palmitoyltransferase
MSWGVHLYAMTVLPIFVLGGSLISWVVFGALYIPSAILAMASLFMASTTNPGAVPLGARPLVIIRRANSESLGGRVDEVSPARSVRRCHKCHDNYKPPRAHHDSVTDRCIVKFDHFCPWVNNSIGALNHKFFCLFLLYTAVTCLLSLLLLLLRLINCSLLQSTQQGVTQKDSAVSMHSKGNGEAGDGGGEDPHHRFLKYSDPECDAFYSSNFVLGLLIASLLFLVFTVSMGCEQLDAVETGKGKIARMKMSVGTSGTEFARVSEEFNESTLHSSARTFICNSNSDTG